MNINNLYIKSAFIRPKVFSFKSENTPINYANKTTSDTFVKSDEKSKQINFGSKILVDSEKLDEIMKILGVSPQPKEGEELSAIRETLIRQDGVLKNTMDTLHIKGKGKSTIENLVAVNNRVKVDPKTGLYNADVLLTDINFIKDKYLADGIPVTFAMFDLDNFKSVNDLLSYDKGDILIKTAAKHIGQTARKKGYRAYRFGGEEFFVIMPGLEKKDALPIAQSIIDSVNNESFTSKYIQDYIKEGKRIIESLTQKQEAYKNVMEDIDNLKHLTRIVQDPEYRELIEDSPKTTSIVKFISRNRKAKLDKDALNLLIGAKNSAANQNDEKLIEEGISKIEEGQNIDEMFADGTPLASLLYSMFYKQDKINEIRKWIEYVQLPNENGDPKGFTMSGGVVQFDENNLDNYGYIHQTGEILAYAKRHHKGRLYQKADGHVELYEPKRCKI